MAHLALMEGDGSDEPRTAWGEAVSDSDYQAERTPLVSQHKQDS
jgi:hypothetical protein